MNAVGTTLIFLLLLGMITTAKLQQAPEKLFIKKAFIAQLQAAREIENRYQHHLLQLKLLTNLKPKKTVSPSPSSPSQKKKKPSSQTTTERASSSSHPAHLALLRSGTYSPATLEVGELFNAHKEGEAPFEEIFCALLTELFAQQPFYFPELPSLLLHRLQEALGEKHQKEQRHFQGKCGNLEELAALDLGDPTLRQLWLKLLRGEGCPSLRDFMSCNVSANEQKINLLWASPPLFHAVLGNREVAQALLSLREQLIQQEEEPGKKLQEAFKRLQEGGKISKTLTPWVCFRLDYRPLNLIIKSRQEEKKGFAFEVVKRRSTASIQG